MLRGKGRVRVSGGCEGRNAEGVPSNRRCCHLLSPSPSLPLSLFPLFASTLFIDYNHCVALSHIHPHTHAHTHVPTLTHAHTHSHSLLPQSALYARAPFSLSVSFSRTFALSHLSEYMCVFSHSLSLSISLSLSPSRLPRYKFFSQL